MCRLGRRTDCHITLESLQRLSSDYKFAVSQSQISDFFSSTSSSDLIDFVCFAQFIRHQETTLKRLFTFIDNRHKHGGPVTIDVIHRDINNFNDRHNLHYFWSIDPQWVNHLFSDINRRRVCKLISLRSLSLFLSLSDCESLHSLYIYWRHNVNVQSTNCDCVWLCSPCHAITECHCTSFVKRLCRDLPAQCVNITNYRVRSVITDQPNAL